MKLKLIWNANPITMEDWFRKHNVSSQVCDMTEAVTRAKSYMKVEYFNN